MPSSEKQSKSGEPPFVYSDIDHLKNAARRSYLERAMRFSKECKRLRRESALTIMFAATALWRSRVSLRAAQAALATHNRRGGLNG
jgi:hypothetical protein